MHDWKSKGTNIDEFVACLQYLIDVPLDYKPVLASDDICGFGIFSKNNPDDCLFIDIQKISYNDCLKLSIIFLTKCPLTIRGWAKDYLKSKWV